MSPLQGGKEDSRPGKESCLNFPEVINISPGNLAGRNINNLRYADDSTLMAETKEEVKGLLMKVKEESEKAGLKLTFKKLRSWHPVPSLHGK